MVKFTDFLDSENNKNKYNLLPASLPAQQAIAFLCNYLLGEDWYIADSISPNQANTEIVFAILEKYSKKFRKELNW